MAELLNNKILRALPVHELVPYLLHVHKHNSKSKSRAPACAQFERGWLLHVKSRDRFAEINVPVKATKKIFKRLYSCVSR